LDCQKLLVLLVQIIFKSGVIFFGNPFLSVLNLLPVLVISLKRLFKSGLLLLGDVENLFVDATSQVMHVLSEAILLLPAQLSRLAHLVFALSHVATAVFDLLRFFDTLDVRSAAA